LIWRIWYQHQPCSETLLVFLIKPPAQHYGTLIIMSWLCVAVDTAGKSVFAGTHMLTNRIFNLVSNVNRPHCRLRHQ